VRNFLSAEEFYKKRDFSCKLITVFLVLTGIGISFFVPLEQRNLMRNFLEPFRFVNSLSIVLYFIIPIQMIVFMSEGFVNGTIKSAIGSGMTLRGYYFIKIISAAKTIFGFIMKFYLSYYIAFMINSYLLGITLEYRFNYNEFIITISPIVLNFLYLMSICVMLQLICFVLKKASLSMFLMLSLLFISVMVYGFGNESGSSFLKLMSDYSNIGLVLSFSNSHGFEKMGSESYFKLLITPIIKIILVLPVSQSVLHKDINID